MDKEKELKDVVDKIENFNDETKLNLKLHVEHEMTEHKHTLPKGMFYGALHEEIEHEVDARMEQFTKQTDLKPKDLYTYLDQTLDEEPNLSKRQLHYLAYDHLAQTTDIKFLKKIFKKMRKRMK